MSNEINVTVRNRRALCTAGEYVCANSDFPVLFDFDDEWSAYEEKTAVFSHDGITEFIVFSGSTCLIPEIVRAYNLTVGVTAGNLRTTTAAQIPVLLSALSSPGYPPNPHPDVYAQIMDLLNKGGASAEQIQAAVQDYLEKNPPQGVSDEHIRSVTEDLLAEAKASGEFDGEPGKDGDPGKDGKDYILTEADKQEIASMVEVSGGGGNTVTDDHINSLIDAKLGVIENGAY